MGGISNFFLFVKRAYYNHSEKIEFFIDKFSGNVVATAGITFAKFLYISFVLFVAYSYINLAFTLLKTLINFYYLVIDYLNNGLNNSNNLYYNPFLIAFKNVFLPPLMFVIEIVFPIYLFIFKGAVIRGLYNVCMKLLVVWDAITNPHLRLKGWSGLLGNRKLNNGFNPRELDK